MKQLDAQRGFSLLEILAALAIGVLMMTSLTAMVDVSLADTKSQQVAKYQEQFTAAASRYISDKAASLYTSTGTTTSKVTLAMLSTGNYLPIGFALTNAYQQTPCVLVRQHTGSLNAIDALVVTEGLNPIPPKDLAYVAANAGSGGGVIDFGVPPGTSLIAHGTGWQLDTAILMSFINANCSGTPATNGSLASALFYGGPNGINQDVLYRNPASDPKLNQMNMPLGFTASAMQTAGNTCTSEGITLETVTGNILKCNTLARVWENSESRFWKDPVQDYLALTTLTTLTPAPLNGEVRMTLVDNRAFMFRGGVWNALAVDQSGNFTVPNNATVGGTLNVSGTATANNVVATLDIAAGQDIRAARDIQAAQDLRALRDIASTRDITAGNNITATQTVKGNLVYASSAVVAQSLSPTLKRFAAGEGCNYPGRDSTGAVVTYLAYGSIVSDVNGLIMECRATASPPGIPAGSQGVFIYVDGSSQTPPP